MPVKKYSEVAKKPKKLTLRQSKLGILFEFGKIWHLIQIYPMQCCIRNNRLQEQTSASPQKTVNPKTN
jgi:hypothetical protein